MARRNGYNPSQAAANPATYTNDSTYGVTTPNAGTQILASQGKGIIDPLPTIKDHGNLKNVVAGEVIPSNFDTTTIITYVNTLANESMTGNNSSCRSACTGLCVSTCTTACKGECTAGCGGSCASNCTSTCGSDCASSCLSNCTGNCANSCSSTCASSSS